MVRPDTALARTLWRHTLPPLLAAINRAEADQDNDAARRHVVKALALLQPSLATTNATTNATTRNDNHQIELTAKLWEKLAGLAVAAGEPAVGLVCLQRQRSWSLPLVVQFAAGLGRFSLAIDSYRRAQQHQPSYPPITMLQMHLDMAELAIKQQRWAVADAVLAAYQQLAATIPPVTNPDKIKQLARRHDKLASFFYLGRGDYKKGFPLYEHRFLQDFDKYFQLQAHHRPESRWRGEMIQGEVLLISGEQGIGDVIQYCRFLPQLSAVSGARQVIFETRPSLLQLLAALPMMAGITLHNQNQPPPPFDRWAMMGSLPALLGLDEQTVAAPPYIPADTMAPFYRPLPPARPKQKKLALVWSGNGDNPYNKWRALDIRTLLPLFGLEHIAFYSLQRDQQRDAIYHHGFQGFIHDCGPMLRNMYDTAALIKEMDGVLSICTSLAHLAAAMDHNHQHGHDGAQGRAKPLFLLLPHQVHWVWGPNPAPDITTAGQTKIEMARRLSPLPPLPAQGPWYGPWVETFRQTSPIHGQADGRQGWHEPVTRLRQRLAHWAVE